MVIRMDVNLEEYQHLNSEYVENRKYSDKLIQFTSLYDECRLKISKEEREMFDKQFSYKLKTINMLIESKNLLEQLNKKNLDKFLKKGNKLKNIYIQVLVLSIVGVIVNYFFEDKTNFIFFIWFVFIMFNSLEIIFNEIELSRDLSQILILKNNIHLLERDLINCIGGDSKVNELFNISQKILNSEGVLEEESKLMYEIKLLHQKIYFLKDMMKNREFVDSEEFKNQFHITDVHNQYYKIGNR